MGKVVERLRGEKKKWLEGLEVERINIETSKGVFGRRQKVKHKAKAEEPFYTLLRDRHRLERMRMRIENPIRKLHSKARTWCFVLCSIKNKIILGHVT